MESCSPDLEPSVWTPPEWLEQHLIPDGRFARAYNTLGDKRRALLKGLIARHFALNSPNASRVACMTERFGLMERSSLRAPASFALLLLDDVIDAPALFLAALMPLLCARIPQVLAVRLGKRSSVPDSLLASCELAGQERLAALGPVQLQRLLADCAATGQAGVVLHPDTCEFRRLLGRESLRELLVASAIHLVPLRAPRTAGLWRDTSLDFPPEDVALLYGPVRFEALGAEPGMRCRKAPDESAWSDFCAGFRDLLLVPAARTAQARASIIAAGECLGMWRWPELHPSLFVQERQIFIPT